MEIDTIERKLQIIIGEQNGPPFDRATSRLTKMIAKLEAAGGTVPDFCRQFIEQHELEVPIGGKAKKSKPKADDGDDG